MIAYLKKNSVNAYLFDYHVASKNLEECTERLNKFIVDNKLNNVILVGHSMGGLTAINYCNKYGWSRVKRVLTICTPFSGVRNFGILNRFVYDDLKSECDFLTNIKSYKIPKDKVICAHACWDEFMSTSATVLPNSKEFVIDVYGHNNALAMKNMRPLYDIYLLSET